MSHSTNHNEQQKQSIQEVANQSTNQVFATSYDYQTPAIQGALYVLWAIHNKKYSTGARLFYEEVEKHTKVKKETFKQTTAFLEGAGLVVNEVVIASKVPTELIERYGIVTND